MSGRMRGFVYSWHHGRLHWHRYVVPKDLRTPAQQRSRAAFGKASKAWSESQPLTEEQRDDWYAEAADIKCKPRLTLSGFRTAQQHFVGTNSLKERWGLPLLLKPPERERKNVECRMQNSEAAPEVPQQQGLNFTSWDRPRAYTRPLPDRCRAAKGHARRSSVLRVPTQVSHFQSLTRPSSERPQTSSRPLPVSCWCQARAAMRGGGMLSLRLFSALAHIPRTARFRELWRGG
jgi:hypothetical protein